MAETFFHVTAIMVEPGSIIRPGNWGRIMRRYQRLASNGQTVGDAWILSRELIFEMVRREHFPTKPSRWDSAFCCPTLEAARDYQDANDLARLNLIYRVTIIDKDAPRHVGPLAALNWLPNGGVFVENYETLAKMYWAGQNEGAQEIVTTSRLKVLEIV